MGNKKSTPISDKAANNKITQQFIIKYCQNNKVNDSSVDITSLDRKRVIFISLIGAVQSWRKCPSFVLYSAIFLIPFKTKWIIKPEKYAELIQKSFGNVVAGMDTHIQ